MSREALRTLFHPYESEALAAPRVDARVLFIGAEPGFRLPEDFAASLALVQGFRPHFLALERAGYDVKPRPEGSGYSGAMVLCGRHRRQNEAWLAEALQRVVPGGTILAAGTTDDGIASLRKRMEKIVALDGHLPKYHGIALWLRRPDNAETAISALREEDGGLADGRFVAAPGMFSHDRVDAGSRLLAEHLPESWKGRAADFGAGWGYLSTVLAERTKGLSSIDLYEADFDSLEAARLNMAAFPQSPPAGFFWHDLAAEKVDKSYDLIVMNPPFHQGRAAEPEIGQAMIKAASSALRRAGALYMVQNRGLPYDQTLRAGFSDVREIAREAAFRVIVARR